MNIQLTCIVCEQPKGFLKYDPCPICEDCLAFEEGWDVSPGEIKNAAFHGWLACVDPDFVAESGRFASQIRRSRINELPYTLTQEEYGETLNHFGHKCAYCGAEGPLEKEHFIPVALGGGFTADNIVPACVPCNRKKRANHPEDFLPYEVFQEISEYLSERVDVELVSTQREREDVRENARQMSLDWGLR